MPPAMGAHLLQRPSPVNLPVARQVEVIAYVTEAAVQQMVVAARLKIQALPLRGGRAVDYQ